MAIAVTCSAQFGMARPYSTENVLNPGTAGGPRSPELAGAEVPLAKFLASGSG
ncbi:MAG TPA: hypothetical protein VLM11_21715 [Streptosporangiaceae bacterium]|nr:hypothetical protein [Streptosporangiaceae bacterium]